MEQDRNQILRWPTRLSKLRAMSLQEIAGRLRYRLASGLERWQHRKGFAMDPDRLASLVRPELAGAQWREALVASRRAGRAKFFQGLRDPGRMRQLFQTRYAAERRETMRHAERARRHLFSFFGQTFAYDAEIDWHADPVSGRRWPLVYHADVPVHAGDVGFGDVKYVWELSRHQCLIDLGKSFFLGETPEDAAEARAIVRHWIANNPYATGVNWACALEPAFRTFSWLWAYYCSLDDDGFEPESHLLWLSGFYDHGRFLYRHLEHHSSPFNHLAGEAAALYALGVLFPEFCEAAAWRRRGRQVLESRIGRQFYADGGSVEQSTFYHHATLGFYLLAALLGRANGEDFAQEVWRGIERAIEFELYMMQPNGRVPEIGGADDGKPIRMEHLPLWDFRPYQAIGAVLFSRPDFKCAATRFHEDALWLLGPEGLDGFERLESALPRPVSRGFESSGYYLMRSNWSDRADYVCFDCGEQAAGMRIDSVPNSMHGHADCLSIIVWLGGRPVLIDPGFYCYNGTQDWDIHFRKTGAHSTALIDGRDQARHVAKMAWCHAFRSRLEAWAVDQRQAYVVGSHDGYARGPNGVVHRRTVWMRPGGYIVVHDEFLGEGEHDVELNFQFAPGSAVLTDDCRLLFRGDTELCWTGSHRLTARLCCGGAAPHEGWIAPSLGLRVSAPRLTLTSRITGSKAAFVTVIADLTVTGGLPRVRMTSSRGTEGRAAAISVDGADSTDWIATTGVTPGQRTLLDPDAPLGIWRLQQGRLVEVSIGGPHIGPDDVDRSVPDGVTQVPAAVVGARG